MRDLRRTGTAGLLALALSAAPALAQQQSPALAAAAAAGATTVRVEAEGVERAAPDRAVIDIGVRTEAAEAAAAAERNASTLESVLAALRPVIGAGGSLGTSSYSVQPRWEAPAGGGQPRVSGYVVQNTVTVTVAELGRVSRVIDTALAAGANELQGLAWTLGDETPVRVSALRRAVATARARAQAVASELGMRLVRVVSVEETSTGPRPMPFERGLTAAAAATDVATPTEPARVSFRSSVTLTAELAPR